MKYFLFLTLIIASYGSFAQNKPLLESKEDVEIAAINEFEAAMKGPEGSLYQFGVDSNISGSYTFKVTLGDKGKVISVFVLERDGGTIGMQNLVKDAVKAFKFNFKLPKNKTYSVEYKFNF